MYTQITYMHLIIDWTPEAGKNDERMAMLVEEAIRRMKGVYRRMGLGKRRRTGTAGGQ